MATHTTLSEIRMDITNITDINIIAIYVTSSFIRIVLLVCKESAKQQLMFK